MTFFYAAFIADGYCYEVSDDEEAADHRYWLSLKLTERGCPVCAGEEGHEGCDRCDGCGVVTGEPFTIVRYDFASEEDRDAAIEAAADASDGYDRAGVIDRLAIDSTDVMEWSVDEDDDRYRLCPCCRVYRVDSGWRVCPDCQDSIEWSEFRRSLADDDRSDPWGFMQSWRFALAAEAYCRGILADELSAARYRPGLSAGRIDPDDDNATVAARLTDDAVAKGWRLISRYADMIKRAGRSY